MKKRIIFWGGTGHAKVLRELVNHFGYDLIAVFDNNPTIPPPFLDVPLIYGMEGFQKWKKKHGKQRVYSLVAIGGAFGRARLEIQNYFEKEGLLLLNVIHPSAYVAGDALISKGSQVLSHATVCTEVQMGEACILNTACSVDHECRLGNGVHIGPGACLAGVVSVGDCSFIGAGAVVLPRIKIGENVIIGAGSVVTRDVMDGVVAYGNPARVIRKNSAKNL